MRISKSSGEQTADAAISAGPCLLTGLHLISDETNDVKVVLYDNASAASGTVVCEANLDVSAEGFTKHIPFAYVEMANGIYADVTGTGASYVVEYVPFA